VTELIVSADVVKVASVAFQELLRLARRPSTSYKYWFEAEFNEMMAAITSGFANTRCGI
jgi:hypothetical protein